MSLSSGTADIPDADIISRHMIALSANPSACAEFGIDTRNVFGFWDWVGGRFSVCSAVGVTPLALHYGFDQIEEFLEGARSMDRVYLLKCYLFVSYFFCLAFPLHSVHTESSSFNGPFDNLELDYFGF